MTIPSVYNIYIYVITCAIMCVYEVQILLLPLLICASHRIFAASSAMLPLGVPLSASGMGR